MAQNGKRYTEEFKRQIIDLYLAGKPVVQLVDEYGLVEQTIYKWKKFYALSIKVDENQTVSLKDYRGGSKGCNSLKYRIKY
ncbi:MAG: transposase [Eubacteriales bacterium]|nr:transposase [Eubacteriales bacterium]